MAINDGTLNPYGFQVMGTFSGNGGFTANMLNTSTIENGYATTLYTNDLVTEVGGYCVVATTSTTALGALQAVQYLDASSFVNRINYFPANTTSSKTILASIIKDPSVVYSLQSNDATGITQIENGLNAQYAGQANGSAVTGFSAEFLDSTTVAATQGHSLNIVGVDPSRTVSSYLQKWGTPYNSVLVRINNHKWNATTIGA